MNKAFASVSVMAVLSCMTTPVMAGFMSHSAQVANLQASEIAARQPEAREEKKEEPAIMKENHENQGHERSQGSMVPGYSAPGRIDVGGKWDFWGDISFIYWQPRQEKFYVATRNHLSTPTPPLPRDTSLVDFNYKFKPGFKVGIGMAFPNDNWTLGAEWTWLHGKETTSASAAYPERLEPWFATPFNSGDARHVTNKWTFRFDIVDVSLARPFYSGTKLILTPYFGGRLFFNHQQLNGTNLYDVSSDPVIEVPFTVHVKNKVNAWELGPRAGLNGNWMLGRGFSVVGDFSLSILYANFKMKHLDLGRIPTLTQEVAVKDTRTVKQFLPNMDLSFGFKWGTYVNQARQHIEVGAKYDFLYFWGNNMISDYSALQHTGPHDLCLQGLTITGKLDF